jgi:predicted membrane channel-forming protein YqfA (hemolysin III family)
MYENKETDENKEIYEKNIPYYLKDKYVTNYIIGKNHTECIYNLFKLHHESVNAWTMICSNVFVILIIVYIFLKYKFDKLYSFIFILHLLAYTIHTPFSVGFHTFSTIDKDEFEKWRKYDVYGIFLRCIILTFTLSFFTYDNFKYVLMNTSLTLIAVYYSLLKYKESEDKYEKLDKIEQGKLVGYVALTSFTPMIYKIYNSIKYNKYNITFKLSIVCILFYILSLLSYMYRIPDKYFEPGKFNKIGTSHNIMHLGLIITSLCEVLYIYYSAKEGNKIKSFK